MRKSQERITFTLTRAQARMLSGAAWKRAAQLPSGPDKKSLELAAEVLDTARRGGRPCAKHKLSSCIVCDRVAPEVAS